MMICLKKKKRTLLLSIILLSIAILWVQGVKFHVHNLDHDHEQQHDHIPSVWTAEHSHISAAHLATDISHIEHHNEAVSEIDVTPDGLLKKGVSNIPDLSLLATLFTVLLLSLYQFIFFRRHDNDAIFPWHYYFYPPLRAPPL